MGIIPDNYVPTIKELIVEQALAIVSALRRPDNNEPVFKNVIRGNPDDVDLEPMMAPYCFIEESVDDVSTTEMYTELVYARHLSLIAHVKFSHPEDEVDAGKVFNYYIGELQKLFFANPKLNDTCMDIDEVSQSPEIYKLDRLYGGYIVFRVRYRHKRSNPTQRR